MEVSTRGDVKGCKASSLMYEYIFHRSKSEEFMAVLSDVMDNGFERKGYVRRLSIHATETGIAEERLPDDLSHLHTLAVFGTEKPEVTKDLANGLFGNKGVLAKYKILRVLDLKECAGMKGKHLQTICDLLLLKYLSLGDSIVRVPRKIAQLKLLETLDLSRTNVVTVYMQVLGLPSLTHLLGKVRLSKWDCIFGMEKLKRFVRNKCKLDTLGGFTTGKSEAFPQLIVIGHMRQLNKVKIWIHPAADTRNLEHLTEGIKEFVRKTYMGKVGRALSVDFSDCIQEPQQSLNFLNLQDPQTEEVEEIVNIQDNTQGAQLEQDEEANPCLGTDGGSTSNQITNIKDNIQEQQTEEIQEPKQGAPSDSEDACSRNETEMMQNHQNIREGYDKCRNKLSSLKLCGKLTKFPLQFVTEIAGIERLCLSSTGLSGENIAYALSELPDLFYLKLREDDLSLLDLQNKQFPSLRRICFSVKDGNLPRPTIIKHFRNLREVYLYANLNYEERRSWKAASESHPERPRVYFAESTCKGTSSEAVTQSQ
ncbi:disease resistance protein RGA4-like isoform X1 [Triticum dicoccoides]|uniref:disease resistance protein RGA4-like isoform X1 n=1 Tax=Triticum dicoccoides TaxID=85692 RepID=UPI000E7D0C36|nr:disease resistance protein RGA4-like isoform X1 [Triticum dicoccoides]XP_037482786.1 disease resistance protein RGA4-like isoform X1 [Triticum dicoccoides]